MAWIGLEKGVRVDARESPKPARSPECASPCHIGGVRGRVLRLRTALRLSTSLDFGVRRDSAPPVSRTAISYSVAIDVAGGDRGIRNAAMDASSLYKLRKDAPPDGVRRSLGAPRATLRR